MPADSLIRSTPRYHILHVGENPFGAGGYMEVYVPPPDFFEQIEQEARKQLESLLTREEQARYGAVLVYRTGVPATGNPGLRAQPRGTSI